MKLALGLGLAASLFLSFGCSGSSDEDTGSPELAGTLSAEEMKSNSERLQAAFDELYTREQQEAMIEQMERANLVDFGTPVSVEEERAVLARLASQGISADRVSITGRMVSVDRSDAYYFADDLIDAAEPVPEARTIEKGYALGSIVSSENFYQAGPSAPEIYARLSGSTFQFWRPALSTEDFPGVRRIYYLVIESINPGGLQNPGMPANIRTALVDAANSIMVANSDTGATPDCIRNTTFQVINQSTYDALTNGDKLYHYKITVRYRPASVNETYGACASVAAYACANFPRRISKSFAFPPNSASALRMSFGTYIGIPSNGALLTPAMTNQNRKEFLQHELGHVIGLSHPFNVPGSTRLRIPGTASRIADAVNDPNYQSMMDYDFSDGLNANPLSNDDRLSLRKLYAANGCGYTDGFQNIQ